MSAVPLCPRWADCIVSALVCSAGISAADAQAPTQLPRITVNEGESQGALPEPYAGGQVSRGGRVGLLGNRDVLDTPFNVTNYTSATIENQQAATIGDVIANDPSVRNNAARGANTDEFTVRGFTLFNRDIALNGLFGIVPPESVPTELAERVEVLKGPSALLNGMAPSGSIGGGINVVTKTASEDPLTRLTVSGASDSLFGGHIDAGRRFGAEGRSGLRFNGAFRSGDTARDDSSEEMSLANVTYDLRNDRLRFDANLSYWSRDVDASQMILFPGSVTPSINAPDATTNFFQPWTFFDGEATFGTTRFELDFTDNLTGFVAAGFKRYEYESLQTNWTIQNADGLIRATPFYSKGDTDVETGEVGLRAQIATGTLAHTLVFSATGYQSEDGLMATSILPAIFSNVYEPVTLPRPTLPQFGSPPRSTTSELVSFAVADTISALEGRMQLTLGLRKQQVESESFSTTTGLLTARYDESATTPMVGLVVKPWSNVSLYGNYIEGLSQGPTAPTSAVNAGQIFPPFEAEQFEAGVKVDWGSIASTVSVFQIEQPSGLTDPVSMIFSVDGEQRNRGVEINVFGELNESVRLLGGLMFLDAELVKTANGATDGNTALGSPDLQVNLGAEWDAPFIEGLTLSSRVVYTDSQYANATNTIEIPDWTRIDLGARYALTGGRMPITLRANVENLFNKDYWSSAGRGSLKQGAPRTALLSMTVDF